MEVQRRRPKIELVQGDVAKQEVDAIVNAANSRLAGGGGVDGAIHRAAGPSMMEETRRRYPAGCPTGDAVVSHAGNLQARYVIHAVGPVYSDGSHGEDDKLAAAYRASLRLAAEHQCDSIALPALSTGAYRYPVDEAAAVAIEAAAAHADQFELPSLIRFVLFDPRALSAFEAALSQYGASD